MLFELHSLGSIVGSRSQRKFCSICNNETKNFSATASRSQNRCYSTTKGKSCTSMDRQDDIY